MSQATCFTEAFVLLIGCHKFSPPWSALLVLFATFFPFLLGHAGFTRLLHGVLDSSQGKNLTFDYPHLLLIEMDSF